MWFLSFSLNSNGFVYVNNVWRINSFIFCFFCIIKIIVNILSVKYMFLNNKLKGSYKIKLV